MRARATGVDEPATVARARPGLRRPRRHPDRSFMFRASVLEELGGLDPSFRHSEDMDLLVRLRERKIEFAILPNIILYRRFHGSNMTANPPTTPPVLRSLREKLARERTAADDG